MSQHVTLAASNDTASAEEGALEPRSRPIEKPGFAANVANFVARNWIAVLAHLALIVAWQLWVTLGDVPSYVMPSPVETFASLGEGNYDWVRNTLVTAGEILAGYSVAVVFGVVVALLSSWSRIIDQAVMPLMVSLNMIPKVALGPLFIVWFSYGFTPNVLIVFAICVLPILLTTARGLKEVEPDLLELVRALKGSRWQIFTKIQLPSALPYVFSGMKVATVLAVAGAVVGEFIASQEGLGYLMLQVQVTLDTAAMFMSVLLITLIGVVLYGLVQILEFLTVPRDSRVATA
ncbi:ABC transporter permease [Acuticoccus mangrovi]|uniref:ABC transporter permease n=1 Tax=Acuticoccus mangrovi TaxID=2796142 RepID=A0A934INF0_9HYPH|nr:ABC transporter permease [Acuticoccus mangrovi]MBJ3775790.1 ABC transporter permease [Acuticoccus mangrovi]